jgi:hypothetical protein
MINHWKKSSIPSVPFIISLHYDLNLRLWSHIYLGLNPGSATYQLCDPICKLIGVAFRVAAS